jgi:hypothetical protein
MISLFRKIRQKLLSQNKVTRYLVYALGEIFLVVIGILIALQINNWNANRQSDKEEQKILKILKAEFLYNKGELAQNIAKAGRLETRANRLINLFNSGNEGVNMDSLAILVRGLTAYSTFDPSNGALTNIISSGNLNLIKNDSLRITLSKWFGEVQDVKEDEKRIMAFGDNILDPLRLEYINYLKDSKFDRRTIELLNDPKFENMTARMAVGVNYIIENYQLLDKEIQEILRLLDQEIKS